MPCEIGPVSGTEVTGTAQTGKKRSFGFRFHSLHIEDNS